MSSDSACIRELHRRIECVERENRRLRWAGMFVVAIAGAGLIMGQALPVIQAGSPKQIEAERFLLKSADGQTRGIWGLDAGDGTTLSFSGKDDKPRLAWTVRGDGQVLLSVYDKVAKERASLKVLANGATGFTLHDREGVARVGLKIGTDDMPSVGLSDKNGNPRGIWRVWPDGGTGLSIHDKDAKERGTWRINAEGLTNLSLWDKAGKLRAALGTSWTDLGKSSEPPDRAESSIVLYDAEGKTRFSAP